MIRLQTIYSSEKIEPENPSLHVLKEEMGLDRARDFLELNLILSVIISFREDIGNKFCNIS